MKFRIPVFFAIALMALLLVSPALAGDLSSTLAAIDDLSIAAGFDAGQHALYQTYALFAPHKLPASLQIDAQPLADWTCATPTVLSIRNALPQADAAVKQEIKHYLPFLFETDQDAPVLPKGVKTENPEGAGYDPPNKYKTEHFNFKWGNSSPYTQNDIEAWGVIFEEIWSVEVESWGFDPVFLHDQYYIDVYLGNTGDVPEIGFLGAYTTIYNNYQPLMVFHPDILSHEEATLDISSHEFFHCLQFTIGFKPGGCPNYMMGDSNGWGVEGTAVWAEDQIYNDLNYYVYQIEPFADAPHYKLNSTNFQQLYARVIWWKYVSENFDGLQSIFDLWNDGCHGSMIASVENIFSKDGTTLEQEFPKFAIANLFMDYEEGSIYPDFRIHSRINSYPDSYEAVHNSLPQVYGTNYVELTPDGGELETLYVQFTGDTQLENRDLDWIVQVVAVNANKAGEDYDLTTLSISKGSGQSQIDGFGSTYDKIYLVISPISDRVTATGGANYKVKVSMTDPSQDDDDDTGDDDDDDAGDDDDASGDDDDDDDDGGCGC